MIRLAMLPPGDPCQLCRSRTGVLGDRAPQSVKRVLPGGWQMCPICDTGAFATPR